VNAITAVGEYNSDTNRMFAAVRGDVMFSSDKNTAKYNKCDAKK
jgi:hypothetical protein